MVSSILRRKRPTPLVFHRHSQILATAVAALTMAQPATAQQYIPGFLNPVNRTFHAQVANVNPSALVAYSGTFDVTLNITVASSVPANQQILCDVSISGSDSVGDSQIEDATVAATRNAGTATCVTKIPFAWSLAAGAKYTVGYTVSTSAPGGPPGRSTTYYPIAGKAIPAAGTITKIVFPVTI